MLYLSRFGSLSNPTVQQSHEYLRGLNQTRFLRYFYAFLMLKAALGINYLQRIISHLEMTQNLLYAINIYCHTLSCSIVTLTIFRFPDKELMAAEICALLL